MIIDGVPHDLSIQPSAADKSASEPKEPPPTLCEALRKAGVLVATDDPLALVGAPVSFRNTKTGSCFVARAVSVEYDPRENDDGIGCPVIAISTTGENVVFFDSRCKEWRDKETDDCYDEVAIRTE